MTWLVFLLSALVIKVSGNGCPSNTVEDSVNRKCYSIATDSNKTWSDASDHCTSSGGSLAKIENETQQLFVNGLTSSNISYWIGARNISIGLLWGDNSNVTWSNFSSATQSEGEFCVTLLAGTWVAENCSVTNGYICQMNFLPKCPDLVTGPFMSVMNATEPVYVNETKVVTCDIGYMFQELGSRTQEVLCQMNYTTGEAQYNNDIGVCEEVQCSTLPTFVSMLSYYNATNYNSSLVLKCVSGYIRNPSTMVTFTCNETGSWDPDTEHDVTYWSCSASIYYDGCFANGALAGLYTIVSSVPSCRSLCRGQQTAYYGLNGDRCVCGNMRITSGNLPDNTECSLPCPYDQTIMCGGSNGQVTVYKVLEGCYKFDEEDLNVGTWRFKANGDTTLTCRELCRGEGDYKLAILLTSRHCVCANRTDLTTFYARISCATLYGSETYPDDVIITGNVYTLGSYPLVGTGACKSLYAKGIRYHGLYYTSNTTKEQCNFYDGTVCDQEWIGNDGNCYTFGVDSVFEGAFNHCRGLDSHLVTVLTESEHEFLRETILSAEDYRQEDIKSFHFGLYDESQYGNYEWVDGAVFAFSRFASNEPSNDGQCGLMSLVKRGRLRWYDADCSNTRHAVCKRNPGVYYGCIETMATDLDPYLISFNDRMTIAICFQKCHANSKSYSAVLNTNCYCFDEPPAHKNLTWTKCYLPCPGHKYQPCGGISSDETKRIVFVTGGGAEGMFAESCTELELMGISNDTFQIVDQGQIQTVACEPQGGVSCPLTWISINGKCYKFSVARNDVPSYLCSQHGGYLTPINQPEDIETLRHVINNATYLRGPEAWLVGLFDMNLRSRYRWANGMHFDPSSVNVYSEEGKSRCFGFYQNSSSTELVEVDCSATSYICTKDQDYVGCYKAPTSTPVLSGYKDNSIQQCVELCRAASKTYAMVQQSACWCDDVTANVTDDDDCTKLCFEDLGQACPGADSDNVAVYLVGAYTSYATSCEDLFNQGIMVPGNYVINGETKWCSFADNSTACASASDGSWVGVGRDGVCFVLDFKSRNHSAAVQACRQVGALAAIHDQWELDTLTDVLWNSRFYSGRTVYVGGFDPFNQGLFSWSDGTLMTFAPWDTDYFQVGAGRTMAMDISRNQSMENTIAEDKRLLYVCREVTDDRGCYTKPPGMNALAVDYFTMTLTLCKQLCLGQRKQLALVHPSSCFCADEADMNDMTPANDVTSCDTPCLGNPTQFCGGENALRAYELDYNDVAENCSVLYGNGVLYEATYLLRNPTTGINSTTTCGFNKHSTCAPGWIEHDDHCLFVVPRESSLVDAVTFCTARDSHLYSPLGETSPFFLYNLLTQVGPWSRFQYWHLGATSLMRNSLFQLADGDVLNLVEMVDDQFGWSCLFLDVQSGTHVRQKCKSSEGLPFICDKSPAYLGCKNISAVPLFMTSHESMSVGQCMEYCKGHDTSYAGLIGPTCHCFDNVTSPQSDGVCDVTCSDTTVQLCGSSDGYMSLYKTAMSFQRTCTDLFDVGVTMQGVYVIHPAQDPFHTECFARGIQYEAILGSYTGVLTGSSENGSHIAENARIASNFISSKVWKPESSDIDPWIQIDLSGDYLVTAVTVQGGRNDFSAWTSSFGLLFSIDGSSWESYGMESPGNLDPTTPTLTFLLQPFVARLVRVLPRKPEGLNSIALRLELYGQIYEDFSHSDRYVGCFAYFDTSEFFLVADLLSVDQCRESCQSVYPFYTVVRENTTSKCGCAYNFMTYGRLNDSACNISSHTGSTPSGNEAMHSAAVFRTYDKHCPDVAAVGNVTFTVTPHYATSAVVMTYRTNVKFTCLPGHELQDSGDTEHTITCMQNGTWSGTPQSCQIKYCPEPVITPNGTTNYTTTYYGSNVTYQCDPGFEFSPGVTRLVSECLDTKKWSETSPICERKPCPSPPEVTNAVGNGELETYRYGDSENYTCKPSSAFGDNSTTKTIACTEHGNWTRFDDSCVYFECPEPPLVPKTAVNRMEDDVAVYTCITGYEFSDMSSSVTSTCGNGFAWSDLHVKCVLKGEARRRETPVCLAGIGKRSLGDLDLVTARSQFDCASACLAHEDCRSYNYRRDFESANCELLLGTSTSNEFSVAPDWNAYHLRETCG